MWTVSGTLPAESMQHEVVRDDSGLPKIDGRAFPYERLKCYWKLRDLRAAMMLAGRAFPQSERRNLTDQLRRAATSMVLNPVEGSLRTTGKAQANFTANAFGSLHESFECIKLAVDDGYLDRSRSATIRPSVWELTKMLSALRAYQLSKKS